MTDRLGEALADYWTTNNGNRSYKADVAIYEAARAWHTLTNPNAELIERVADLAGERNGFWQIPPVAAAYVAAAVDALTVTPTPEDTE